MGDAPSSRRDALPSPLRTEGGGRGGDEARLQPDLFAQSSPGTSQHGPVELRPLTRADEALIDRWITQPEIQRWWGDGASAFAEVRLAQESPSAICRIVMVGGKPAGYGHAIDAGLWGSALPEGLQPGTWDVDLFIAEASARGRGAGETALGILIDEVFATTMALAVSVFVSIRNEAAVRIYEKAGFRWVRIWEDPAFGPMWLMVRERGATAATRPRTSSGD